jgi:hypothetical protein
MNERIGQLAEQAGLLGPGSRIGNSHDATERFAELIVRECLDQLHVSDPNEDYDKGIYWSREQIKNHFGVEE